MPLLAFIRKDTGWRIDWQIRRLSGSWAADSASLTRKRFYCGGIVAGPGVSPPAGTPKGVLIDILTRFLHAKPAPTSLENALPHAIVVGGMRYIAS
ncbi:hypothetical protein SAMN05444171_5302 [Bradyrhizobium lablabi]|jgi:hypothetical protein|uniref:Uncharacterized protein n=2 Tax=Bradyrhizobium TaxID=374 RepID=A0ABY0PCI1_9BRAD|nr:hypothetical protein SAMN05444163_1869 [Bradyrhizobium ottawaense]SED82636.1 hypothetical protein SAMN05444171_5302 [Bradyrhizobium lablabi]SHL78399.1 hypothetical protein SAMN05444321_4087 [Bradyrhizobium lablabi]